MGYNSATPRKQYAQRVLYYDFPYKYHHYKRVLMRKQVAGSLARWPKICALNPCDTSPASVRKRLFVREIIGSGQTSIFKWRLTLFHFLTCPAFRLYYPWRIPCKITRLLWHWRRTFKVAEAFPTVMILKNTKHQNRILAPCFPLHAPGNRKWYVSIHLMLPNPIQSNQTQSYPFLSYPI